MAYQSGYPEMSFLEGLGFKHEAGKDVCGNFKEEYIFGDVNKGPHMSFSLYPNAENVDLEILSRLPGKDIDYLKSGNLSIAAAVRIVRTYLEVNYNQLFQ